MGAPQPIKEAEIVQVRVCGVRRQSTTEPDAVPISATYLIEQGRDKVGVLCYCGRSGYSERCPTHAQAPAAPEEG